MAYLEQTVRAMEQGNLKIRVRSLENEQALARIALSQQVTNKLLMTALLLNIGLTGATLCPLWCGWRARASSGRRLGVPR